MAERLPQVAVARIPTSNKTTNDPWTNQGSDSEKSNSFIMSNHTATTPEPPTSKTSPLSLVGNNNTCLEMGEWYRQMKNWNANHYRSQTTRPLPIWMPAYPGSGSELMRDLVNELTQNETAAGALFKTLHCRGAVTCKTHFPLQGLNPEKYKWVSKQAVLLLRNPCSAIPSFFNFR
jgi:hypothetical protein